MNRTIPTALAALTVVGAATAAAWAQPPRPSATAPAPASAVRDRAKMFSTSAAGQAERLLREAESQGGGHWATVVTTVDSLNGRDPRAAAADEAKKANVRGLLVLIAKNDKKVQIEPSERAREAFPKAEQERVVRALTNAFRQGAMDDGLLRAAEEIRLAALGHGVADAAGLFSADARAKADRTLADVRARTGRRVVVETVPSLDGKDPAAAAADRARERGVRGLYVLIAPKETKIQVVPSGSAEQAFPRDKTRAINDALVSAFRAKEYDRGLSDAVGLIAREGGAAASAAKPADAPRPATTTTTTTKAAGAEASPALARLSQGSSPGGASDPGRTSAASTPPPAPRPTLADPGSPVGEAPKPKPTLAPAQGPAGFGGGDGAPAGKPESVPEPKDPSPPYGLLLGGLAVLVVVWLVVRSFRRKPSPEPGMGYGPAPGGGYAPPPGAGYGAGQPGTRPVPPQAGPRPGYGPTPPPPGYAPGYGPTPPPGYGPGYGPAPAGGAGGGFVSGALGGLGGAVVGNILYDKFGRPHPAPGAGAGPGEVPTHASNWPHAGAGAGAGGAIGGAAGIPPESYDPNAGTGGDWGTPDAPTGAEGGAVGGDWGTPDPNAGAAGGDWGTPEPAPETGGDWGAPDDAATDAGPAPDWASPPEDQAANGGDWGGADPGQDAGGDWGGGDTGGDPGGDWGGGDTGADPGGDWGGGTDDQNAGGGW